MELTETFSYVVVQRVAFKYIAQDFNTDNRLFVNYSKANFLFKIIRKYFVIDALLASSTISRNYNLIMLYMISLV